MLTTNEDDDGDAIETIRLLICSYVKIAPIVGGFILTAVKITYLIERV